MQVGNKFSKVLDINNDTTQGSVISPLLFLVMINDLPLGIRNTELTLFADDSCVFKSGRNLDVIVRYVQQSIDVVSQWCQENGFKIGLSMEKTVALLFTHRRESIQNALKLNDNFIKVENKAKISGFNF